MCPNALVEPEYSQQQTAKRPTILIVDDDDALRDVLSLRLEQQGFQTITADSGREGLLVAQSQRPRLIVLDLHLPDTDGFTVCQHLVDTPGTSDIPVIILSGMERPDIIRRCRAVGSQYFVRKPYDPNALLVLIWQAIREAGRWDAPGD